MAYECQHCGKKLQNPQALKMHLKWKHSLEATKSDASKSEEAIKPLKKDVISEDISDTPISEISDDLEIEEAELEEENQEEISENNCPHCNFQLKDYETPCPNCGAIIEWGD